MRPAQPKAGTDNARLLDAMLQAYPNAVWNPNSRLNLMAHSRAADLRKLGWDVEAVNRRASGTGRRRDYGYVLKSIPDGAQTARTSVGSAAVTQLAEPVVPAGVAAERCGLSFEQLRYLDRMGSVPFDVVTGAGSGQYLPSTVRFLQAAGVLAARGIGLDHAITLLRQHRDELEAALRLVPGDGEVSDGGSVPFVAGQRDAAPDGARSALAGGPAVVARSSALEKTGREPAAAHLSIDQERLGVTPAAS